VRNPTRGRKTSVILMSIVCTFSSSDAEDSRDTDFDPSHLVASDTRTRLAAVAKLQDERTDLIASLLKIVKDPRYDKDEWTNPNSPRNLSVRCLGRLRAKEAVSTLIGHLTPKQGQVTGLGDEPSMPAAFEALVEIGVPAFPPLLRDMATSEAGERRMLCAKIITKVVGKRAGKAILLDSISRQDTPEMANRLRECLLHFE